MANYNDLFRLIYGIKAKPIMYHGTIDRFIPSILKEGLKPMPKNAWMLEDFPGSDKQAVYLTNKEQANFYAYTRVNYWLAKPNEKFYALGSSQHEGQEFYKSPDAPVLRGVKARLIEVHLTPFQLDTLEKDYDDHYAFKYAGIIRPDQLKVIDLS